MLVGVEISWRGALVRKISMSRVPSETKPINDYMTLCVPFTMELKYIRLMNELLANLFFLCSCGFSRSQGFFVFALN